MEPATRIDPRYIVRVLQTLCGEGDVIEARILGVKGAGHVSGYFDNWERLASAVAHYDGRAEATYFTPNPVQPVLLARGDNRLVEWAKHTTSDADIVCRRWMLIDFDPVRPAGISSSDVELEAAIHRREEVIEWLDLAGFSPGLWGMSGNGAHLLYRLDNLPNDEEHTALIRSCIAVIAARFGDKTVDVDRKVFNPARLCKLYGTLVRKGDNVPDRPYRRSRLDIPDTLPAPVSLDQLRWLSRQAAEAARVNVPRTGAQVTAGRRLDVPAYLAAARLAEGQDYRIKRKKGMTWYNFRLCPVHANPNPNFECGICQSDDGAMGAKCQHDSTKSWRDFKVALGDPARFYVGVAFDDQLESSLASVQPANETLPVLHEIDLDQVLTFARCPTEHLWRYKTQTQLPLNSERLVREVTRAGLLRFYEHTAPSPLEGALAEWRKKLSAWESAKSFDMLDKYARMRLQISVPFISGQVKHPNGKPYPAPQMAEKYHTLYAQKGLLNVRAEADGLTLGVPVVLGDDSLADLFADTVEIALRCQKSAPSEILGLQEQFSVCLPDGRLLTGRADLVFAEGKEPKTILEVWDWSPIAMEWTALRHDLRVIAALYASSDKWPSVDQVHVRYLRTGDIVPVYSRNLPAWMLPLLAIVCNATMQASPIVPRLAVSALQCEGCPYLQECIKDDAWNSRATFDCQSFLSIGMPIR